ncbi:hypothetical protein DUI87_17973 [Hirundo rustica rustica]|uniref:Uncharacterized protein n=1 Tax=Hirundo rustica rustica TaxID=333673 RepID=A0A3M0JX96_HIRRU|nr:hypothetical protein DUI87_17973 [Hirundo rustica rustica]
MSIVFLEISDVTGEVQGQVMFLRGRYWDQHSSTSLSVTRTVGLRAPSESSPVTPSFLEQFFHTPEGWEAIHRGLGRSESWTHVNLMNLNVAKYQVLHLAQGNPKLKYRLSREWTQISSGRLQSLGL